MNSRVAEVLLQAHQLENPVEQMAQLRLKLAKELDDWRTAVEQVLATSAGKDLGTDKNTLERQRSFARDLNWIMDRLDVRLKVSESPRIPFRLGVTPTKSGLGSFQFIASGGIRRFGSKAIPGKLKLTASRGRPQSSPHFSG